MNINTNLTIKVMGKGRKERLVPLNKKAYISIDKWKKYSRDELRDYSVNELDALRRRIQAVKSAPIGRS